MSTVDEILPARTMSWSRAIGSYIFAAACGVSIGVVVAVPVFNVVWKICFAVAVYLAAAVLYLWVVLVPPGGAPIKNQARAKALFARACSRGNIAAAADLLETGCIPDSLLQAEATRLHSDVESAPKSFQMFAWLVGRLCKKSPSVLWQTQDSSWSGVVDRWALGT
jgi:hypothetical protein